MSGLDTIIEGVLLGGVVHLVSVLALPVEEETGLPDRKSVV